MSTSLEKSPSSTSPTAASTPPPTEPHPQPKRKANQAISDTDNSGVDDEAPSKRPRIDDSLDVKITLLTRDLKRFVRTDYPFLKFSPIFQAALHYSPLFEELGDEETLEFESERSESMWNRWLSLKQAIPSLEDVLMESAKSPLAFRLLVKSLDKAVGIARSDDTKLLRSAVVNWLGVYQEARRLSSELKSDCGFRNSVTGAFLSPIHIKWLEDEEETAALRDHCIRPSAREWPRLLYAHENPEADDDDDDARYLPTPTWDLDPRQPWKGFGCGQLLLRAWACLFAGSVSIDEDGRPMTIARHTEYMSGVTRASIAYTAMQLRHALNSEDRFVVDPKGSQFDSPSFYNHIMGLIENPSWKNEVQDLLRFYNYKFFPQIREDGTERVPNSTLNLFEAALKVRNHGNSEGRSDGGNDGTE